ncbi:NDR1/HIN1-like protein 1 [Abeliophyllum distichum]|uniref:NDR1/HIN1-like protein 1 n=1 Tax=Abeliophyllum distichum TaxID=126358 RepID=A0ABD1W1L0_9LAMI
MRYLPNTVPRKDSISTSSSRRYSLFLHIYAFNPIDRFSYLAHLAPRKTTVLSQRSQYLSTQSYSSILSNFFYPAYSPVHQSKQGGNLHDELVVYASYKGQKITSDTPISGFYQGQVDTNLLSTSMVENQQAVAPFIGYELGVDQSAEKLAFTVKLMGRLLGDPQIAWTKSITVVPTTYKPNKVGIPNLFGL